MDTLREEVRRSLHQHMMQLYTGHLDSVGQHQARQIVGEELKHMAKFFGQDLATPPEQVDPVETFWRQREGHPTLGSEASGYVYAYDQVGRARAHYNAIQAATTRGEQE